MQFAPRRKVLYEGSTKIMFEGPEPNNIIQHFKDDIAITADDKRVVIGKGVVNNRISEFIMSKLSERNLPTHFIKSINMREQLVKKLEMMPIRVNIRNVASGSMCTKFGIEEGIVFPRPVLEFCLKSHKLGYPIIAEDCIIGFGWVDMFELDEMKIIALRVNDFLSGLFMGIGIRLVDFKLEFGKLFSEEGEKLVIADEISPDNCRLWDIKTNDRMDKDRIQYNLDKVQESYLEIARRFGLLTDNNIDNNILEDNQPI